MRINWKIISLLIFLLILVGLQTVYWLAPLSFSDIKMWRDGVVAFIEDYPIVSALLYIIFYTLSIIFGLPISITIIGGYFFGLVYGVLYSSISIVLGAIILTAFVRYVAHGWIRKRYAEELGPINKELKNYGVYYIAMIHAIPFMPSFLPHVATGISSIPLYKVGLFNLIGALPLTVFYTYGGSYIHQINSMNTFVWYTVIFGGIIGVLFLGISLYRYYY